MDLDKFQKMAMQAKERNVLVVAAPGSGKTTLLINRVNYILEHYKITEDNILILTFTKAAAVNMKNRYISTFNKERSPFFGTFHGLFYKILRKFYSEIKIIEPYMANKIIESVLAKYFDDINEDKIKEIINNISLFNNANISIEDFEPSVSKNIFIECYEAYTQYKIENKLWDFDDLAIKVVEIFSRNDKIREGYKKLYKYILVDEFQDCDELQMKFLKIMNGENNNLFAVGDEDQCIYSFRGSRPEYMVNFSQTFKESKKYYLSINYRSKNNIVELSKRVIRNNIARNNKEIISFKKDDGLIEYYSVNDERMQAERLARIIKEQNGCFLDNVVLYRTKMESATIIDSFIRNNIPFKLLDKEYNFFEHFICKDIIAYLKLAVNSHDRESFSRIINKPFRYISKININYVLEHKEDENVFDILIDKEDMSEFQRKSIYDLKRDFNYLSKVSLMTAIQYIMTDLLYIDYLKAYSEKFSSSIEDLEEIVEIFKNSASSFKTINEFLNHIKEVKVRIIESKKSEDKDRVLLGTIHSVKGMEFNNVFIINANEDIIPHSSSKDVGIEEERRIFYVGITRSINKLYLFSLKNRRGKVSKVSRFIREGKLEDCSLKKEGFIKGKRVKHSVYGEGIIKNIDNDYIKILFQNEMTKKFSLNIIREKKLLKIL